MMTYRLQNIELRKPAPKVEPIPTLAMRRHLEAQGKRIVHRPSELEHFNPRDPKDCA